MHTYFLVYSLANLQDSRIFLREYCFTLSCITLCRSKAQTAVSAVSCLNQDVHCKAYTSKVCTETEALFNCRFWGDIDVVLTALDNVDARLYIDSQVCFK